jgi:hypothetical protein
MDWYEETIKILIKHILEILGGLLALLAGKIYVAISSPFFEILLHRVSRQTLLECTGLSVLILMVQFAYIFYLHNKMKTKLIPKFGIFWDKEGNPYCPSLSCKSPLSQYGKYAGGFGFKCMKCNEFIFLRDDKVNNVSLDKLLEQVFK